MHSVEPVRLRNRKHIENRKEVIESVLLMSFRKIKLIRMQNPGESGLRVALIPEMTHAITAAVDEKGTRGFAVIDIYT